MSDATYQQGAYVTDYKPIPPIGTTSDRELEEIVDCRITYANQAWLSLASKWRLGELMDKAVHWSRPAWQSADGGVPWQWYQDPVDPDSEEELPRPVLNEGFPIRQNESARLARPRYLPEVRPGVDNPDAQDRQACKRMTRYMLSELYRMRFATEDDIAHYRSPVHGQQILKGWWEQRWDELVSVPAKDAKKCPDPGCDFKSASGMVDAAAGAPVLEKNGMPLPEDAFADQIAVENCWQCDEHPPLEPFTPNLEDPQEAKDSFGRPLSTEEPKGNYRIDCLSPYDLFLPECGFNKRWDDIDEYVHCHVESLDWIAAHWPKKAHLVKPESPAMLMKYHPIAGSPLFYGSGPTGAIFRHHARVKELFKKPWMEWDEKAQKFTLNRGRYIVFAGGIKLAETDLLMPSLTRKGEFIERAWLEMPPWELMDGAAIAWGMSLWDQMVSPALQVDEIASQRAAIRERCAVPLFWTPKDSNFSYVNKSFGVPGAMVTSEVTPGQGAAATVPRIISNVTAPEGMNTEDERYVNFLNNVGGRSDVEKGDVPGNVSAATAINILKEESGTTRTQRIERIKASRKRLFNHMAHTIVALTIEPRSFRYEESNGRERWDKISGFDFQGQMNVDLEPQPEFDSEDQQREALRDILQQPIDLNTPLGRMIAKNLGAPAEITEVDDIQELLCDREYKAWLHDGKAPIMDPSLDDGDTHYKRHGARCAEEEFTLLEEQAGWDKALEILSDNWDQDLQMATQPATAGVPMETGMVDPMTGRPQMLAVPYMQAVQMGLAQPVQPMSMEQRIENAWMQKLQMVGFASPDPLALKKVMAWRRHVEACKLYAQMKQQAAAMQPVIASPGAEQTQAGTEVTASAPAAPMQPQMVMQ